MNVIHTDFVSVCIRVIRAIRVLSSSICVHLCASAVCISFSVVHICQTLPPLPKPRQLPLNQTNPAPQLILAGEGTGKTTTITAKIAYMVEKENIEPSQILALTFSKEAARHMREKVEKLPGLKSIHSTTPHPSCVWIMQTKAVSSIRAGSERCALRLFGGISGAGIEYFGSDIFFSTVNRVFKKSRVTAIHVQ